MNRGVSSFSQEGEDILLSKIFRNQAYGLYVDIGASHPIHYSNTYLFYRRGWRGINVEPLPGAARLFRRKRPRDITLELGIGEKTGKLPFYTFQNSVMNTFEIGRMHAAVANGDKLIKVVDVQVERLDAILTRYLPENAVIDFMNIDVEGGEESVIRSNDWSRYRPKVLSLEILDVDIMEVPEHRVAQFLKSVGYVYLAKGDVTAFFREKEFVY